MCVRVYVCVSVCTCLCCDAWMGVPSASGSAPQVLVSGVVQGQWADTPFTLHRKIYTLEAEQRVSNERLFIHMFYGWPAESLSTFPVSWRRTLAKLYIMFVWETSFFPLAWSMEKKLVLLWRVVSFTCFVPIMALLLIYEVIFELCSDQCWCVTAQSFLVKRFASSSCPRLTKVGL